MCKTILMWVNFEILKIDPPYDLWHNESEELLELLVTVG